jgi:hypothetical protein
MPDSPSHEEDRQKHKDKDAAVIIMWNQRMLDIM